MPETLVEELVGIEDWNGKKYLGNEKVEEEEFTVLDARKYLSEQYQNGQEPHPEIQEKVENREYKWIERKLSEAEEYGLVSKEIREIDEAAHTGARPTIYSLED